MSEQNTESNVPLTQGQKIELMGLQRKMLGKHIDAINAQKAVEDYNVKLTAALSRIAKENNIDLRVSMLDEDLNIINKPK